MWAPRISGLFVLAVTGTLALAPASGAAVSIGSDLTADSYAAVPGDSCDAAVPCTWVTVRSPSSLPQTAPFDGVVVRWRLRSQDNGYARLQVIALGAGDHDSALRNAYLREPVHPGVNTFADRVPIEKGATVGISDDPGGSRYFGIAPPGAHTAFFGQPLQPGYGPGRPGGAADGLELLMNADIEPDADHDGYGDETQDACPTDSSTQGPCPAGASPSFVASFRPHYRIRQALSSGIAGTVRSGTAGTVTATAKIRSVVVARGRASLGRPGQTPLVLHLTRHGQRALRHIRHRHVTVAIRFHDDERTVSRKTVRIAVDR